jgi:uncharacterized protein
MARAMLKFLLVFALGYAAVCVLVFVVQRSLIYFPQPRGMGGATIALPIDAGQVLVSARPHVGPGGVLYFGGNAEDVSYSLLDLSKAFPDSALYLMHYRGYGGSAGKPSEAALVADALALFDKVRTEHSHITVIGRSLGSGVAVQLAAQRPVARLVLVTPYNSLLELGAQQFPFLPVHWLMRDRFESWRHAPQVKAPTNLVVAEHDEVIPRRSSDALARTFGAGVASFRLLTGTSHNTISGHPSYLAALKGEP